MCHNQGFTLLELMVALVLAGSVAVGTHRIFIGVTDGVSTVGSARESLDRQGNVRRLLASLAASVEVGRSGTEDFLGGSSNVAFSAWHTSARGHSVRRRVRIGMQNGQMMLDGLTESSMVLSDSVEQLSLDYLLQHGSDERFVREWYSDATPPIAIRFRIVGKNSTDTLLLMVGPRG